MAFPKVKDARGTAGAKSEEGGGYGRSVRPESPGLHARYKGWDNGLQPRKRKLIPKPSHSSDWGLQLALMKLESVVIACQHQAVNMPLLLAHTARQTTRVGFEWGWSFCFARTRIQQGGLSRNKVSVGEPADGSPPIKTTKNLCAKYWWVITNC